LGKNFGPEDVMNTIERISEATSTSPSSDNVLYGITENPDNTDGYTVIVIAMDNRAESASIISPEISTEEHIKTYLHKFRCSNCRLHFIVYSWNKEFPPAYCPECGKRGDNFHWIDETDRYIHNFVPGDTLPPGFVKS
jgi:rubrerythrin